MPQTPPDFIRVKWQYKPVEKCVPTTETAMPQTLGARNTMQLAEKELCGFKSFFAITMLAISLFLADRPSTRQNSANFHSADRQIWFWKSHPESFHKIWGSTSKTWSICYYLSGFKGQILNMPPNIHPRKISEADPNHQCQSHKAKSSGCFFLTFPKFYF